MKKSKWFTIKRINQQDKEKILQYALKVREQKNELSQTIMTNFPIVYEKNNQIISNTILEEFLFYSNRFSMNDFVKLTTKYRNPLLVDSVAFQCLCRQVYTLYKLRISKISYKINRQGNILEEEAKKFLIQHPKNTLQEYVDYLKFLLFNIQNYSVSLDLIVMCLAHINEWYNDIHDYHLNYLNSIKPIQFKSLTFMNINKLYKENGQLQYTIQKINNKTVNIKLNIPNKGIIELKSRYNEEYFGKIEEYKHTIPQEKNAKKEIIQRRTSIAYSIKFLLNGNVKINFYIEKEKDKQPKVNFKEKAIGVDLNTKHNFVQCSDGKQIKYEEQIIKHERNLRKYLRTRDINRSKNNNKETTSKKRKKREEKQARRRLAHANLKANELKQHCIRNNIKRVVMEDLNISLKTPKKLKNKELLQNHIQTALLFNDFKNIVKRILNKAGIEVDYVNARYTSQTCSICGTIAKENRQTQEKFICVECKHEENADLNASKNILERVMNKELRSIFEYFDKEEQMYKGKNFVQLKYYQEEYRRIKKAV